MLRYYDSHTKLSNEFLLICTSEDLLHMHIDLLHMHIDGFCEGHEIF